MNTTDYEQRAMAAYFRFSDPGAAQPSTSCTEIHDLEGRRYVSLGNVNGLLACYRVRNDGKLKRLVRVPEQIVAEYEGDDFEHF